MKHFLSGLIALSVLTGTGMAFAATPKPAEPKREILIFDRVTIEGTTVGPSLTPVFIKPSAKFANRIKTRGDFVPELLKSVDNL